MNKLALTMLVVAASNNGLMATENKPTTELKIVNENSFMIADYYRVHPRLWIWDKSEAKSQAMMDNCYELYGQIHNVDVKTLRGENFQPREFWSQPFEDVLHTLYPLIAKYHLFNIAGFDTDEVCFSCPKDKYCYEFVNDVPHTCPEIIEYFLEEDTHDKITKWMKKRGLKPIDWS